MNIPFNASFFWYVSVCVVFVPFILVSVVEPEWLGRLIGISFLFYGIPFVGLWYVFGPKKNLGINGKIMWPKYLVKHFGDKVYLGTRILILALVGVMLCLLTIPFLKDTITVVRGDALPQKQAVVTHVSGASVATFLTKGIVFDGNDPYVSENVFYSWYFSPNHFKYKNSYEFLYLPHSHIILYATEK